MKFTEKQAKLLRWIARVWSLPAILFIIGELVFPHSESDVQENWLTWVCVGTLFSSTFSLALAWFKARLGGWLSLGLFALFLVLYAIDAKEFFPAFWLVLAAIAAPAVLFLLSDGFVKNARSSKEIENVL